MISLVFGAIVAESLVAIDYINGVSVDYEPVKGVIGIELKSKKITLFNRKRKVRVQKNYQIYFFSFVYDNFELSIL